MSTPFERLYDASRGGVRRILASLRREPTGARPTRGARIKLESLPTPLRAVVRDESESGILLKAELPWLVVGSEIQTEVGDGAPQTGRVHWFGVDATKAGSARLSIFVDLLPAGERTPAFPALRGERASGPPSRQLLWISALVAFVVGVSIGAVVQWPARAALRVSQTPVERAPVREPSVLSLPKAQTDPPLPAQNATPTVGAMATAPSSSPPQLPEARSMHSKSKPKRHRK